MPLSMTAFANARTHHPWGTLGWELRSVNHRYLDLSFRLPDVLQHLETPLREMLCQSISRGKVHCTLSLENENTTSAIAIDELAAQRYIAVAGRIATLIGAAAPINPLEILDRPGVRCQPEIDSEALTASVNALFKTALDQLVQTRAREGTKLAHGVRQRLREITVRTQAIRQTMPTLVQARHQKLRDKLSEFGERLDRERLEQELVYLAQKADVDEELDRMEVHVAEIDRVLANEQTMGRRLDFLVQELNREANTLAAKAASSTITASAIELKVLIEQIREQIQNIE